VSALRLRNRAARRARIHDGALPCLRRDDARALGFRRLPARRADRAQRPRCALPCDRPGHRRRVCAQAHSAAPHSEPEDLGRFVAETRATAALEHPHCARIFGAGVEEGLAWIATELLTGGSLAGRLAAVRRLGETETLTFGLQAASALAAAHTAGLTHHDLEPNNLVFDEAATLKVTDFGQAVFYERLSDEVGVIWGRPAFVAPERLGRAKEDELTDIYGLGATLFCALTGTPPYNGEAHGQMLFDRMGSEPIRIEDHVRPIHTATAAVLNRMLTASRGRRVQSWEEVIEDLTRAHTELTGRAAPPDPEPHPVHAPAPRIVPPDISSVPALPANSKAPVAHTTRAASLFALAMFAAIICVLGFLGWKQWFAPKPRLPARAPAAIAPIAANSDSAGLRAGEYLLGCGSLFRE
jgi:serine/threonine protein kinase